MKLRAIILTNFLALTFLLGAFGQAVPTGPLQAGAAKVDITPNRDEMPKQYVGVLDEVYSRAIVVDNGHTSAALVTLDAGVVPNDLWKNVSELIEQCEDLELPV